MPVTIEKHYDHECSLVGLPISTPVHYFSSLGVWREAHSKSGEPRKDVTHCPVCNEDLEQARREAEGRNVGGG